MQDRIKSFETHNNQIKLEYNKEYLKYLKSDIPDFYDIDENIEGSNELFEIYNYNKLNELNFLNENFKKWFDNVASSTIDNVKDFYHSAKAFGNKGSYRGGEEMFIRVKKVMDFLGTASFKSNIEFSALGGLINKWYNFKQKYLFGKLYTWDIDHKYNRLYNFIIFLKNRNPHMSFYELKVIINNYMFVIGVYDKILILLDEFKSKKEDKQYINIFTSILRKNSLFSQFEVSSSHVKEFRDINKKVESLIKDIEKTNEEEPELLSNKIEALLNIIKSAAKEARDRYIKIASWKEIENYLRGTANKNKTFRHRRDDPFFNSDDELIDFYKVLNVNPKAKDNEIKAAYKKAAVKNHPDKFTDETLKSQQNIKFQEITIAYTILSNKVDRMRYNEFYSSFIRDLGTREEFGDSFIDSKGDDKDLLSSFEKLIQYIFGKKKEKPKKDNKASNNDQKLLENEYAASLKALATSTAEDPYIKKATNDATNDALRITVSIFGALVFSPLILTVPVAIGKTIYARYKKVARIKALLKNSKNLTDKQRKKYESQLKKASRAYVKALKKLEDFKAKSAQITDKLKEKYKDNPEELKKRLKKLEDKKKKQMKKFEKQLKNSSNN